PRVQHLRTGRVAQIDDVEAVHEHAADIGERPAHVLLELDVGDGERLAELDVREHLHVVAVLLHLRLGHLRLCTTRPCERGGEQQGSGALGEVRHHCVLCCGSTRKTSCMPVSRCSEMWQCSIQSPGFDISTSRSTVEPSGITAVSFQTKFVLRTPSRSSTRKRWPCRWIGWCIGCNNVGLLCSRIFTTSPTENVQSSMSRFFFPVFTSRTNHCTSTPVAR